MGIRCAGYVIDEDVDIDGTFTARYRIGRAGATLVRPDGVIAWRAKGSGRVDELEQALRNVLDRLRCAGSFGGEATKLALRGDEALARRD